MKSKTFLHCFMVSLFMHLSWYVISFVDNEVTLDCTVHVLTSYLNVSEIGITQNWFQKVVSRDHQIRLRRQNSIRSEQQIDMITPVTI